MAGLPENVQQAGSDASGDIERADDPRLAPLRRVIAIAVQGFLDRFPHRPLSKKEVFDSRRMLVSLMKDVHIIVNGCWGFDRFPGLVFGLSVCGMGRLGLGSVEVRFVPEFTPVEGSKTPAQWLIHSHRSGLQYTTQLDVEHAVALVFTHPYAVNRVGDRALRFAEELIAEELGRA